MPSLIDPMIAGKIKENSAWKMIDAKAMPAIRATVIKAIIEAVEYCSRMMLSGEGM